jgi:hypothetical protein
MATHYNPALSQEPRNQAIKVAPQVARQTLLGWLESAGRLKPYEVDEFHSHKTSEDLDEFLEPDTHTLDDDDDDES